MKAVFFVSAVLVLFLAAACSPVPEEELNITTDTVVVQDSGAEQGPEALSDSDSEMPSANESVEKPVVQVKSEKAPDEQANTTASPSPITGAVAVDSGPRTVVADGMIEVEEGERVRVVIPN